MTGSKLETLNGNDSKERWKELADEDLVEQFLQGDEIVSDRAFTALVRRHGPMVMAVCRQLLDQEADAEDAFQATFFVLSRRVTALRNRAALGAWLREVAHRTAVKARVQTIRRRSLEKQSLATSPSQFVTDGQHQDAAWSELRPVLHDEVHRLPEKYRLPVILSYLEGRTNEEVAELLSWPVGTVKGRLSRARGLLRSRLMRRGVTLSAALLVTALADGAAVADVVPPELISRTATLVRRFRKTPAAPDSILAMEPSAMDAPSNPNQGVVFVEPVPPNWFRRIASRAARFKATLASPVAIWWSNGSSAVIASQTRSQSVLLRSLALVSVMSVVMAIGTGLFLFSGESFSDLFSAVSAYLPGRPPANACH